MNGEQMSPRMSKQDQCVNNTWSFQHGHFRAAYPPTTHTQSGNAIIVGYFH